MCGRFWIGRFLPVLGVFLAIATLAGSAIHCWAQTGGTATPESPYYSRANTFGILAAYSNDSSHILLGIAENRRLLEFGAMYSRRLLHSNAVVWQYSFEFLPVVLESDPVEKSVVTYTQPTAFTGSYSAAPIYHCQPGSGSFSDTVNGVTLAYSYSNTCIRQWTVGEAMSPVGFQWNFRPRKRLQPYLIAHGGYLYTTQPIPVAGAGSFNFTFDFGAGLELFRPKTQAKSRLGQQSIQLDYRYHHISNHNTAAYNPGIDNGIFQLTWAFGK